MVKDCIRLPVDIIVIIHIIIFNEVIQSSRCKIIDFWWEGLNNYNNDNNTQIAVVLPLSTMYTPRIMVRAAYIIYLNDMYNLFDPHPELRKLTLRHFKT